MFLTMKKSRWLYIILDSNDDELECTLSLAHAKEIYQFATICGLRPKFTKKLL